LIQMEERYRGSGSRPLRGPQWRDAVGR
jgi:hypothetical protein